MNPKKTNTLFIALLLLSSSVFANDITPFNASYTLNFDGKSGTATRILTKSNNGFDYKVSANASIASANQNASFALTNGKISPTKASTSYKVAGIGRTHTVQFNGTKITSTYKGKTTNLTSNSQAYDELSLETQIRQELLNNKFTGSYQLVKKTSIETAKFKKSGSVQISTPAGNYTAIKIDRIHDDNTRKTSFYLAPQLQYLPIKVSQTNDGKTMTMLLSKIN